MRYFGKSLVSNTIQADGRPIPFIPAAAGTGILATEDPAFIAALEVRIVERRGGIWEMTAEQYDEELKKKNDTKSLPPSLVTRGAIQGGILTLPTSKDPVAAEVVVETKPAQDEAPTEVKSSRPTVGRVKR